MAGFPSASHQFRRLIDALGTRYRVIAPDYPGFGQTQAPPGFTYSFDRLADVLDGFTADLGLDRFVMYVFDFGGPVGFRLAARHPERIAGLIAQNANAYREGLSPLARQMIANRPGVPGAEGNVRRLLELPVTRGQYEEGARSPELIAPDGWTLDQHFLDQPGRKEAQIALALDYHSNVELYPAWQQWLREQQPPALIVWGRNDAFFPEPGACAYLRDLPDAEIHLFDTGHFALEENLPEIAPLIAAFLDKTYSTDRNRKGPSMKIAAAAPGARRKDRPLPRRGPRHPYSRREGREPYLGRRLRRRGHRRPRERVLHPRPLHRGVLITVRPVPSGMGPVAFGTRRVRTPGPATQTEPVAAVAIPVTLPPSLVARSAPAGLDGLPRWPVGRNQCAAARRLGMGQFELGERGIVGEQSLAAAASDDRADHQGELVKQSLLDQRSDQRRAAGGPDCPAVLLTQLRQEVGHRTLDQRAVRPLVYGPESGGSDVLLRAVYVTRERLVGRSRPVPGPFGERHPAEQHGVLLFEHARQNRTHLLVERGLPLIGGPYHAVDRAEKPRGYPAH